MTVTVDSLQTFSKFVRQKMYISPYFSTHLNEHIHMNTEEGWERKRGKGKGEETGKGDIVQCTVLYLPYFTSEKSTAAALGFVSI